MGDMPGGAVEKLVFGGTLFDAKIPPYFRQLNVPTDLRRNKNQWRGLEIKNQKNKLTKNI